MYLSLYRLRRLDRTQGGTPRKFLREDYAEEDETKPNMNRALLDRCVLPDDTFYEKYLISECSSAATNIFKVDKVIAQERGQFIMTKLAYDKIRAQVEGLFEEPVFRQLMEDADAKTGYADSIIVKGHKLHRYIPIFAPSGVALINDAGMTPNSNHFQAERMALFTQAALLSYHHTEDGKLNIASYSLAPCYVFSLDRHGDCCVFQISVNSISDGLSRLHGLVDTYHYWDKQPHSHQYFAPNKSYFEL